MQWSQNESSQPSAKYTNALYYYRSYTELKQMVWLMTKFVQRGPLYLKFVIFFIAEFVLKSFPGEEEESLDFCKYLVISNLLAFDTLGSSFAN